MADRKELKAGDRAPAFTAKTDSGEKVKLSDFRGKKVILYFYPRDNTSGCTRQACGFRDNHTKIRRKKKMAGREYYGIVRSHFVIDGAGKIIEARVKVSPEDSVESAIASL